MPMPTQVGCVGGDNNLVALAGRDVVVATGAPVWLHGLIGLNVTDLDGHVIGEVVAVVSTASSTRPVWAHAKSAHATHASAARMATPTKMMSDLRATRLRYGL